MTKLSVNVNKVALLRNQRDYGVPSVTKAATVCLDAGAHGITVHPRPDQRHITTQDVHDLAALLAGRQSVEFNIEGNPFEGPYMELVTQIRPTQATLVPDSPGQRTSDHGWDIAGHAARLRPVVSRLKDAGIRVSVFMDPDAAAIARVPQVGADRIELYTESYATAFRAGQAEVALQRFIEAARRAGELGLGVNAGHDLNLSNLGLFYERVPDVLEVSIGHELTADSLWMGMDAAVKAYLAKLK